MAYTTDIEDVVWEIIDILGDNFAAKLDAIETAKSTKPLNLEDIVRWYFGDIEEPPIQNMPCILVKGRGFIPQPLSTNNRYRDDLRIEIECYIAENPNITLTIDNRNYTFEEILEAKLMRYARAIVEILCENIQLRGKGTIVKIADILLSNVIPYENLRIKACRIDVDIQGITNTLGI